MKISLVLLLLTILFIPLLGCVNVDKVVNSVSKEQIKDLTGAVITCEKPYIRHGAECCLDKNDNHICDVDEETTTPPTNNNTETPPAPQPPATEQFCAPHFHKVAGDSMCGTGSLGSKPITDGYYCEGDTDYPENSCPEGMKMNNTYPYADGVTVPGYACYVSQEIGTTSSPPNCPISESKISCATGFVYDAENSSLTWSGGGSAWGCYYYCKESPNPYSTNPNWPCAKTGYQNISGGGGKNCCATTQ